MFVTPVIYPATVVPEKWRWILALNPMSGIISGYRASILNTPFDWHEVALSVSVAVLFLLFGLAYFRKVERQFADII